MEIAKLRYPDTKVKAGSDYCHYWGKDFPLPSSKKTSKFSFEDFGITVNTSPDRIISYYVAIPQNNLPCLRFKSSPIVWFFVNDLNHLWRTTFWTFAQLLMRKIPHLYFIDAYIFDKVDDFQK
jgi:hypothetical protein